MIRIELIKSQLKKNHIEDIFRTSIVDILCEDELQQLTDDEIFWRFDDVFEIKEIGSVILTHFCNNLCLMRVSDDDGPEFFFNTNNLRLIPDINKHYFVILTITISSECKVF